MKCKILALAIFLLFPILNFALTSPGGYNMYPVSTLDWIMDRNIRIIEYFNFLSVRVEAALRHDSRGFRTVVDVDTIQRGTTTSSIQIPTQWGDADGTLEILNAGAMVGSQNTNYGWRAFALFNGMKMGLIQHIGDLDLSHPEKNELIEWNIFDLLAGAQFRYKNWRITAADYVRSRASVTNGIFEIDDDSQKGISSVSHSLFLKIDYGNLFSRIITRGSSLSEAGMQYSLKMPGKFLGQIASGLSYLKSLESLSLDIGHKGITIGKRLIFSYNLRVDLIRDKTFDTGLSWANADAAFLVYAYKYKTQQYSHPRNQAYGGIFAVAGVSRINDYGEDSLTGVYGGLKYYKITSRGMADSLYIAFLAGKNHQLFLSRIPFRDDVFVQIKVGYSM